VPFGAYVQANHKTVKTNSNVTRTLDAIYLRPAQNQQGGHEIMTLNSGKLITRNIVHKIPVTDVVIKAIKATAYKQDFKSVKFKNIHGVLFHHAAWIAGMDYDDNTIKTKKMMTKNMIMKPKTMKMRKNSKKKNRLTQARSTISPQMQERMPIQPYMRKKINWNNRNNWKH
jgi:hypothetical protein